jgi:hypothetical protein
MHLYHPPSADGVGAYLSVDLIFTLLHRLFWRRDGFIDLCKLYATDVNGNDNELLSKALPLALVPHILLFTYPLALA